MANASSRYESLDLWRGVACLFVLLNHSVFYDPAQPTLVEGALASIAHRLWAGVPIFFVISGYCITASAMSLRARGGSVALYFRKRLRRIFPPYWIVLAVTMSIVGATDLLLRGSLTRNSELLRPWWYSAWQWIGSATLTEIWRWHLIGGQKALLLGHAWTLCYEEQFYAVCGLLLLVCPGRYFAGAAAVTVAVACAAMWASWSGHSLEGFFFDGSWIQFALGVWLFHAVTRRGRSRWLLLLAAICTVVFSASYGRALLSPQKDGPQVYFVAGVFTLLALWLQPFDLRLVRVRALRGLVLCGQMCYSLYLIHLPVANFIRAGLKIAGLEPSSLSPFLTVLLCGVPSIWIAWRFHCAVERRFMSSVGLAPATPVSISMREPAGVVADI